MHLNDFFMIKEAVRNRVRANAIAMPLPYEESGASGPVPDRFRIGDMGSLGRLETQRCPYNGAAATPPAPASPGRIRRPRALARAMPLPTEEPAPARKPGRNRVVAKTMAMPFSESLLSPEERMLAAFREGWNKNKKK